MCARLVRWVGLAKRTASCCNSRKRSSTCFLPRTGECQPSRILPGEASALSCWRRQARSSKTSDRISWPCETRSRPLSLALRRSCPRAERANRLVTPLELRRKPHETWARGLHTIRVELLDVEFDRFTDQLPHLGLGLAHSYAAGEVEHMRSVTRFGL